MGSSLSDNYEDITPQFFCDAWKVHSAIHKKTKEHSSLWILDQNELIKLFPDENERKKYLNLCVESIKLISTLNHPQILKINESYLVPPTLCFSSELVYSSLPNETSLKNDEIAYIIDQISNVVLFLHNSKKLAILDLNPSSICLSKSLGIKICLLGHARPISESGKIEGKSNGLFSPFHYCAPELLTQSADISFSADIFSLAALALSLYSREPVFPSESIQVYFNSLKDISNIFQRPSLNFFSQAQQNMLTLALSLNPSQRPQLSSFIKLISEIPCPHLPKHFVSALKFIDNIHSKPPDQRHTFYKALCNAIDGFSRRLRVYKLLPFFLSELKDPQFCSVVIPLVIRTGAPLDQASFSSTVMKSILPLITKPSSNEETTEKNIINQSISLDKDTIQINSTAALSCASILADRVPTNDLIKDVWPIFDRALRSRDEQQQILAISHLPELICVLPDQALSDTILPTISRFMAATNNQNLANAAFTPLKACAVQMDDDRFIHISIPLLTKAWEKQRSDIFASNLVSLFELLKSSNEVYIAFIVPFASFLLTDEVVQRETLFHLCKIIQASLNAIRNERGLKPFAGKRVEDEIVETNQTVDALLTPNQSKKRTRNRLRSYNVE